MMDTFQPATVFCARLFQWTIYRRPNVAWDDAVRKIPYLFYTQETSDCLNDCPCFAAILKNFQTKRFRVRRQCLAS